MGWTIGVQGFNSQQELGIFLFTMVSRIALGPTHPPTQWIPGALSLEVKQLGHEADHSPPSSAKVHSPNMPSWHGAYLKHRDNFTFTKVNCPCA
jgi:hypothetical protein